FEYSNVGRVASYGLARGHLMQIRENRFSTNNTLPHGNEDVAGFGKRAVVCIHDDSRTLDGERVHFTRIRLKGPDQIQVRAGAEDAPVEERRLRGCARADYVRFGSTSSGVDRLGRELERL